MVNTIHVMDSDGQYLFDFGNSNGYGTQQSLDVTLAGIEEPPGDLEEIAKDGVVTPISC